MKPVLFGCLSALAGLLIGIVLTVGFFSIGIQQTIETPIPAPPASQRDVTITASAAFINAQVQQAARQTNLVKQATVALDVPNIIKVAAVVDVTFLGQRINTNATAIMRVTVKNNRIVLAIDKIDTGGLPIPQATMNSAIESLRLQTENQINALVQRGLQGTGLRLSNVRISPSEMIIDLVSQ